MEWYRDPARGRRQKTETILRTVAQNYQPGGMDYTPDYKVRKFQIHIGQDVLAYGKWYQGYDSNFIEQTDINFVREDDYRRQVLGMLRTNNGYLRDGVTDATTIDVFSTAWRESNGVQDVSRVKNGDQETKPVRVWRAPTEDSDQVVDRIYTAIERSLYLEYLSEKVQRLNLVDESVATDEHACEPTR